MQEKRPYIYCEAKDCPIKDSCGRYREYIYKAKNDWFPVTPYIHNKPRPFPNGTNCFHYDHITFIEENN